MLSWLGLFSLLLLAFVLDARIMEAVGCLRNSRVEDLLNETIRQPGTGYVQIPVLLLIIAVGALLSRRLLRAGGWAAAAFALSGAAANVIKVIVHRPRPWETGPAPEAWAGYLHDSGFQSFPSAESSTTFAIVGTVAAFYPTLRAPLYLVAALVAVARVLVNRHHPSDVVAGAMLGLFVAHVVALWAWRRGSLGEKEESDATRFTARARRALPAVGLVIGAGLVFFAGLGTLPLFGRDEAFYAEAAREMLHSGDWITPRVNGVEFFEKPPLYYWLAAAGYRVVGVSPLGARLPAALLGAVTLAVVVALVARLWGRRASLLAGIAFAGSLQIAMIGRMGIMDVPLTCLTTLALLAYAYWRRRGGIWAPTAFGLVVGLAVLLKGLAGGLAPAIAVVHSITYRGRSRQVSVGAVVVSLVGFMLVAAPWYVAMGQQHGDEYTSKLFLREHLTRMVQPMQGHGGPVAYYVILLLISFFPWVAFLPAALLRRERGDDAVMFWRSLLIVWFLVVLIPFSLIRTKLPGYVTPLFPAIAILVGVELDRRFTEPGRLVWISAAVGAAVMAVGVAALPLLGLKLGERVGASAEAWALVIPATVWIAGLGVIALGSLEGAAARVRRGLGIMALGQAIVVGAVLFGVLPVLSPYLGGGPTRLTEIALEKLPDSEIILHETTPEAVAFALRRPVPTYSRHEQEALLTALEDQPTALIAPLKQAEFWQRLPYQRSWRSGADVLLELPALGREHTGADDSS
ncbi:MAG: phosphatase PAP2 family protein [Armatimonadetes bacterium]|nr:phosphatase PAP2 family protein [Armatimonadota bacterium]